ncbi:MAG: LruC domain-containing protein [Lentisphaerales bacterium]|nr:LruC domain-containing protein [Lentisphaerales bacterium]
MDSDNGGIPDNSDVIPDDPKRASTAYFPTQNQHNLLAFEDIFPRKGDYDFNDLVLTYKSQEVRNADNNPKELIMNIKVKAMGPCSITFLRFSSHLLRTRSKVQAYS